MKTSDIQIGTLYAVGEGQRTRVRGIVLSTEPHRMTTDYRSSRYASTLRPDPNGRGYGGRRGYSGERGLPILLTYRPFYGADELPEVTDDELHELAQRLIADGFAGEGLTEDQRVFLDRRVRLEVVRPQAIERLWVDHLEIERRGREAQEAEAQRRDRVRRLAQVEHQRVVDLLDELGIDYRPPVSREGGPDWQTVVDRMRWQELANLLHEVADAAREPLETVVRDALSEINVDDSPHMVSAENLARMREIVGPPKFSELRTQSGRVLTDADVEALADEAGRGYDVSVLHGRGE